jgi:hypothetical protein
VGGGESRITKVHDTLSAASDTLPSMAAWIASPSEQGGHSHKGAQ